MLIYQTRLLVAKETCVNSCAPLSASLMVVEYAIVCLFGRFVHVQGDKECCGD